MATALVSDVIDKAYTKVNGEYEKQVEGSDDWKTYLNVLNQVMESLVHTPFVKWQIFFNPAYYVGTVSDGILYYSIPNMNGITIGDTPFDNVYFVDNSGVTVAKYKLVDAAMFQNTSNTSVCLVAGDGIYLKSTESKIIGTNIRIPAYVDPVPYTQGSQPVIVDSIPWVVASMASFICASSPVPFIARNADRYDKEAQILMKEMKSTNSRAQVLYIKRHASSAGKTWDDVVNSMSIKDL